MNDLVFTEQGLLPPGDYELTFTQLRCSLLANGPTMGRDHNWDTAWRLKLIDNAEILIKQLWQIGISNIFLDGSFVECKNHPNDIDGYFECDLKYFASGDLQRDLNRIDTNKIWTWDQHSRRAYRGYIKKQLPMWHTYRVELYPHFPGLLSGIKDEHGNDLQFPAAFRRCRADGGAKGIIKIVK